MKKFAFIFLIIAGIVFLNGCYYDKEQLLTPPKSDSTSACINYSFKTDVGPLIQVSCSTGAGCHASGSTNGPGALVTYSEISTAGTLCQASIMAGRMPLRSSLTGTQIQVFNCWISNGTPNN